MSAACAFDAETHTYRINGHIVPNVTKVLADLLPGFRASDWHLQRGRAIHACAAMIAKGIPFEHDPRISGQVEAVKRFFREVQPEAVEIERPVYSLKYLYAGTPDLLAIIAKRPVIVDYKSWLAPSTLYQCAAYALAHRLEVNHGVGVELHKDGTYKMSELWNLKRARQEWLAFLTVYRIRTQIEPLSTGEEEHE